MVTHRTTGAATTTVTASINATRNKIPFITIYHGICNAVHSAKSLKKTLPIYTIPYRTPLTARVLDKSTLDPFDNPPPAEIYTNQDGNNTRQAIPDDA